MIEMIRNWISEHFPNMEYEYCYTDMEYEGVAAFGLCNGCTDIDCPYCAVIDCFEPMEDEK